MVRGLFQELLRGGFVEAAPPSRGRVAKGEDVNHGRTRTGFANARPDSERRKRRCTCGEAVRFPDERSEEPCEARSQEGAPEPRSGR